jgi:hypothetical protein
MAQRVLSPGSQIVDVRMLEPVLVGIGVVKNLLLSRKIRAVSVASHHFRTYHFDMLRSVSIQIEPGSV